MNLARKINYIIEFFFVAAAIYILTFFVGCTEQKVLDKDNAAALGSNFVVINGLIYKNNADIPYEGRIIDTVKGKIIEYEVVNGLKNGEFLIHYENGVIQINGFMKDNKNEGAWKYFYPSGKIESEGNFKDDKVSGKWTWYYENGNIKETGIFVEGKREGKWSMYDKNGDINVILTFKDGKITNRTIHHNAKYI